jgi:hypothetical protein
MLKYLIKLQLEYGIYEFCCKLGMKVIEPATKDELRDYYEHPYCMH